MIETWSYERKRRCGKDGVRWHFVRRLVVDPDIADNKRPDELYFRNDDRTAFGLLRFERGKDNPFRNYEVMVSKIMNDATFRRSLLDPATSTVWKRSWK
jgi:hypothetical protein